ncbi:hypothetical protein ACWEJ6_44590 [Nonomuraea sp. NPDC004702]
MPPRLTDEKRSAILDDIRAGTKSRGQIARDHNVSTTTVSNLAKADGIEEPFSRERTQKATAAAVADSASERAAIALETLKGARAALQQMLAALPEASARDAAVAFGIMIDKHRALDRYDADTQGLTAVDAWLKAMMGE